MQGDVVARLLPSLAARVEPEFNVFEVLHHGTHEKQVSNLFAWLLKRDETHKLGDAFVRIFVEEINRGLEERRRITYEPLSVRQEVDTSGSGADIADLVLEGASTVIVVENYYTSDGHGHSYEGYRQFGERGGKDCVVVLMCESVNPACQTDDWELAPVVTYRTLVERLIRHTATDRQYQQECPEQYSFFRHMDRQFLKGINVNDKHLIDFIDAMCQAGEANRLSLGRGEDIRFADEFRELAVSDFNEGRELLFTVKSILKDYGSRVLRDQVNEALGEPHFGEVNAGYQGSYQWTINFRPSVPPAVPEGAKPPDDGGAGLMQSSVHQRGSQTRMNRLHGSRGSANPTTPTSSLRGIKKYASRR